LLCGKRINKGDDQEGIYLDQHIDWVDEEKGICICPHCAETVKINP
jgi:uncharacterized protein (UPF0212 family)